VGVVDGLRYGRTVLLGGCRGAVFLEPATAGAHLNVHVSVSLLPALMPLLARLRHLLDLDAEPAVIDAHLADGGLATLVARRPGLRLPGAFDGFEIVAPELLGSNYFGDVTRILGEPVDLGVAGLDRLGLTAERVAATSVLAKLRVPQRRVEALVSVARAVSH